MQFRFLCVLALVASVSASDASVTYRVFATREGLVGGTTANGHVIQYHDHFCALPSDTVLNANGSYTFTVAIKNPANGMVANNVPVWDIGPWNTHDNYWHSPRAEFSDLSRGEPEAQAAYYNNYNGGHDEFGRSVSNGAGIDLADGTFLDDLGMTDNGWVDVTYNWESGPTPPKVNAVPFSAVYQNADGRQDVFIVGNNNAPFHNYQTSPNGSWNGFGMQSGPALMPGCVLGRNEDGRLEVFAVGTDANLYHNYQSSPNGSWQGWFNLGNAGGGATKVALGINNDGRLEVFITGADKHVYHQWQNSANGGWTGTWSQLGGWQLNGGLTVGYNQDGRKQVFGWGTDGNLVSIWQTAVNGAWGSWSGMGGAPVSAVTCAANQDGRLEVFAVSNGNISHKWQTTPNGSWTASWSSMSWGASSVVAQRNNDGRIELMAIGAPNGYVAHAYQTSANGSWSGFGKLLNQNFVASSLCFGKNQDGRLELFAVGSDTAAWHIWQGSAGGAWGSWSSWGGSWRSF